MSLPQDGTYDKFGSELNRATPRATQALGSGNVFLIPSLNRMKFVEGVVPDPVIVTGSPVDLPNDTAYLIIQRDGLGGALSTTVNFPPVADQNTATWIFDFSTNFTEHTITAARNGSDTFMGSLTTWPMVSLSPTLLTSGLFIPFRTLSSWGVR